MCKAHPHRLMASRARNVAGNARFVAKPQGIEAENERFVVEAEGVMAPKELFVV